MNPQSKVGFRHLLAEIESLEQQLLPRKQQQSGSARNNGSKYESYNQEFHKAQAIQAWLVSNIAQRLRVNPHDIDVQQPFTCYGLDSVIAVSLWNELEDWLGRRLSPTLVYDYPTIAALVRYLAN
jgi:acyl carrier protein